jgi:hypothetical protein
MKKFLLVTFSVLLLSGMAQAKKLSIDVTKATAPVYKAYNDAQAKAVKCDGKGSTLCAVTSYAEAGRLALILKRRPLTVRAYISASKCLVDRFLKLTKGDMAKEYQYKSLIIEAKSWLAKAKALKASQYNKEIENQVLICDKLITEILVP